MPRKTTPAAAPATDPSPLSNPALDDALVRLRAGGCEVKKQGMHWLVRQPGQDAGVLTVAEVMELATDYPDPAIEARTQANVAAIAAMATEAAEAPAPIPRRSDGVLFVAMTRIKPNPWQPRLSTNAEYIAELAADIQGHHDSRPSTCGLLQLPAGRFVDKKGTPVELRYPHGGLVGGGGELFNAGGDLTETMAKAGAYLQLAYGHSRFAAFQHLATTDPRYAALPVAIVTFSDEEMARAAWSENGQRRDLTVYEQAKAIEKYTTDFGWTQEQAAEHLKLNRSTISNKLRLLRLPTEALKQLQKGELSERQAMALLPLAELPEAALKKAAQYGWSSPTKVIQEATGLSSDNIRQRVADVVRSGSEELYPPALAAHTFQPTDDDAQAPAARAGLALQAPRCLDCPLRIAGTQGSHRCCDPACLKVKQDRWAWKRVQDAAAATGLPGAGPLGYDEREGFYQDNKLGEQVIRAGCASLRVYYGQGAIHPQGMSDIAIVCAHVKGGRCACLDKMRRQASKEDPTAQALKAAKKEIASQVIAPAAAALAQGLAEGQVGAWRAMLQCLNYATRQAGQDADLAGLQQLIANYLVKHALGWQGEDKPEIARKNVGQLLISCSLPLPWAVEPPADVCAQTSGDTDGTADGDSAALALSERLTAIEVWIGEDVAADLAAIAAQRAQLEAITDELDAYAEDEAAITTDVFEDLAHRIGQATLALIALAETGPAPQLAEVGV